MSRRRWIGGWRLVAVAAIGAAAVGSGGAWGAPGERADGDDIRSPRARAARVSLFKNGLGSVRLEATLDGAGRYTLAPVPEARLGTLWLGGLSAGWALRDVRVAESTRSRRFAAGSLLEMLEANVGRRVRVRIGAEWRRGEVIAVRSAGPGGPRDGAHGAGAAERVSEASATLILDGSEGVTVVPVRAVGELLLEDADRKLELSREHTVSALGFEAHRSEDAAGRSPLAVEYVARGITWAPSYRVTLLGDGQARLEAKAAIVNDLLDLERTRVELVTGFPHLRFSYATTAVASASLEGFLEALRRGPVEAARWGAQVMSNVVMQQRAAFRPSAARSADPIVAVQGEHNEDLYFYELGPVTLGQGQRGYYPLLTATVPFEHLYTWQIPDFVDADERRLHSGRAEEAPEAEVVWHSVVLTNRTDMPWTTAPAMTVRDGRVLGQDTMYYTPTGQQTELKITQALGVAAEQFEEEVERERDALRTSYGAWDLVTVRGELKVVNLKAEAVPMRIRKTLTGTVQEVEGDPEVRKAARGLRRVNERSEVTWRITVAPGREEARRFRYVYRVYVRR